MKTQDIKSLNESIDSVIKKWKDSKGIRATHHRETQQKIAHHVFKAWKDKGHPAKHHSELKGSEVGEFKDHVLSVHKHMMKHGITDAKKGTERHYKKLAKKTYKKHGINTTATEVH